MPANIRAQAIEISVVAPCYNEMENAEALVARLQNTFHKRNLTGEIVLVNDGSRDNTGQILDQLAQSHANVVVCHHAVNQGIAAAWKTGVTASSGKYVCLIDSDLQYLPEEVWRLYREIETNRVDMVQGFRSSIERLKDSRYLYSKVLNVLLNTLFGMALKDNKSGFVIARKDTLQDILQHQLHYYYFNTFIAVAAKCKGYSIREVETLFKNRNLGTSYIQGFPLQLIGKVLIDLATAWWEYHFLLDKNDFLHQFVSQYPIQKTPEVYMGWRKWKLELFFRTMPLHKWKITYNAKRYYQTLKHSQWLNQEQIQQLQTLQLQQLIRHVYHHVPYYTSLFQSLNLIPEDIQTLEDLQKLPLLSKAAVRENLYFDLFADNHDKQKMLKITTSGSTGEPFVLYTCRKQLEMRWATTFRAAEWTGWRFGDRQARLWHQTIGLSKRQIFQEYLDAWLMNRIFIPAYEMRENNLRDLLDRLKRHRPVLIDGYAESFNFLAHYVKTHGYKGLMPKAMMSSAQILPPQVRQIIEKNFSTQVFDKYGSREFSGIAYECEMHQGYHIMSESYIVEILKDDRPAKPGELGEVVITDLHNYAVPLIRYRLGDLAVAMDASEPCACGRGLPRIGRIEGRSQAIIFCANGTWLPGTFFSHLFKEYDFAIRQFQVIQHEKGAIDLKIVPDKQFNQTILDEVLEKIAHYMGRETIIHVIQTDEIPLGRTGKRTSVISHLNYDFQQLANQSTEAPTPPASKVKAPAAKTNKKTTKKPSSV